MAMEYTSALIRAEQPESKTERDFNISDQGLDRHGSRIYAKGWELAEWKANPVIMYLHSANRMPNPDLVVGEGVKVWFEGDTMASRARFDVEGEGEAANALAQKVLYKLDNKFLRATSVGFIPIEHGWGEKSANEDPDTWYHRKQKLTEWSVVPVPSNPGALMRNLDEWRTFIDKENLKGDDLNQFLKHGFQGAPLLHYLDGVSVDKGLSVPSEVHFHFDTPKIATEAKEAVTEDKKVEVLEAKEDKVDYTKDFQLLDKWSADLFYQKLKIKR